MKTVCVYHTNDVHSCFDAFCGIVTGLKKYAGKDDLILDAGDFCDLKSIMITGSEGVGGIHLLQKAGYDALAVGNNEFFAGIEALQQMSLQGLPMLSCNLFNMDGTRVDGILPAVIVNKGTLRYLVIGVSPYFTEQVFLNMEHLMDKPAYECIPEIQQAAEGRYDICIVLSHSGTLRDKEMAEKAKGIDLIIGGHTHELYSEPLKIGSTWIFQAGCFGTHLGAVKIELDDQNHILNMTGTCMQNTWAEDKQTEELLHKETMLAETKLSQVLYTIERTLPFDLYHECTAVNAVCDALKNAYDCDFACIHNSILNDSVSSDVSRMSLLNICPSPLNPALMQYSGRQIAEAAQKSFDDSFVHQPGRGPGFRGEEVGTLSFSHNVRLHRNPLKIEVNGIEIEPDRFYSCMCDDYLTRGICYSMLKDTENKAHYYEGYIRDLLERELCHPEVIRNAQIQRVLE